MKTKTKKLIYLLFVVFFIQQFKSYAQSTTSNAIGAGHTYTSPADFLGWTNAVGPLDFRNAGTQFMQLDLAGNLGIGNAYSPSFQLDVMNAININTTAFTAATTYYMVDGVTILQNLGNSNIFVGEGAGNLVVANLTGQGNACLGRLAGNSIEDGDQNVCIGTGAGRFNTDGDFNISMGNTTGQNNVTGSYNTCVGTRSGELNETDSNTYYGAYSGLECVTGTRNTIIGTRAGANNLVNDNVYLGHQSGETSTIGARNTYSGMQSGTFTTTGSDNVFNGYRAGLNNNTGSHNTIIGNSTGLANTTGTDNTVVGDEANCAAILNHQTAVAISFS